MSQFPVTVVLKTKYEFGDFLRKLKFILKLTFYRKPPKCTQTKAALGHGQEGRFGDCIQYFFHSTSSFNSLVIHQNLG